MKWLRKWWRGSKGSSSEESNKISPDCVMHEDPLAREVISRAANTGGIVFASRDADGNVEIKEVDE